VENLAFHISKKVITLGIYENTVLCEVCGHMRTVRDDPREVSMRGAMSLLLFTRYCWGNIDKQDETARNVIHIGEENCVQLTTRLLNRDGRHPVHDLDIDVSVITWILTEVR
jgi:hypothetical protein